jgi:tRNA A-37 threonylcarbamoyl transferase component Bud32
MGTPMNNGPVNPGDILAGKYRVDKILGMGAMGVVVAAVHVALGTRVALKFMLSNNKEAPGSHERFLREARIASQLTTSHVARVTDLGTLDSGAPYIVMEFLEGRDLGAILKERGPLPVEEAVEYVLQACEAIGEAHKVGVVHRDIKPANLFLTTVAGKPCVKVLDFGVSKVLDAKLQMTADALALGSPLYMAPEQMKAAKWVDARADIWSLGATLFELVTGKTPFHSATVMELFTKVNFEPPTPLAEYRPDAPAGFEAVVFQCLEKDRERRYENVAELAAALAPFGPEHADVYTAHVAAASGVKVTPARRTDVYQSGHSLLTGAALSPAGSTVAPTGSEALPRGDAQPQAAPSPAAEIPAATGQAVMLQPRTPPVRRRRSSLVAAVGGGVITIALVVFILARRGGDAAPGPTPGSTVDAAGSPAHVDPIPSATPPSITSTVPSANDAVPAPGTTASASSSVVENAPPAAGATTVPAGTKAPKPLVRQGSPPTPTHPKQPSPKPTGYDYGNYKK